MHIAVACISIAIGHSCVAWQILLSQIAEQHLVNFEDYKLWKAVQEVGVFWGSLAAHLFAPPLWRIYLHFSRIHLLPYCCHFFCIILAEFRHHCMILFAVHTLSWHCGFLQWEGLHPISVTCCPACRNFIPILFKSTKNSPKVLSPSQPHATAIGPISRISRSPIDEQSSKKLIWVAWQQCLLMECSPLADYTCITQVTSSFLAIHCILFIIGRGPRMLNRG